ncbi:hypothetical protein SKAU_G00025620 [Synaphobranchus kaupii]|uniref:Uncharacterized protein n=1 Tax=Synaphobranchus kaupii TaxID=118154 RepID=A0A9Q1GCS0_SYNKA|nr:hypothetical protein SKAU_G00025620 [Synaphobranchus kaupii]
MASPLTPDNPFFSTTPSPDGDVPPALTPHSPGSQTSQTTMDHSEYLNWCSEHLLREFISRDSGLHQEAMQWSCADLEELFQTQRRLLQALNQPHREDREPSALAGIAVTMAYSCQIVLNREQNTEHKTRQNQGTYQIQLMELEQRLQTLCQQRDDNLQETQRLQGVLEQQRRDWDQEKREWGDAHHDVRHARDALEAQTKELQATAEAKKEMENLLHWHTRTLESTRREADMARATAHTLRTRVQAQEEELKRLDRRTGELTESPQRSVMADSPPRSPWHEEGNWTAQDRSTRGQHTTRPPLMIPVVKTSPHRPPRTVTWTPSPPRSDPYRAWDKAPPALRHRPSHPSAHQSTHSPPQRPSTLPTGDSALPQVRVSPRHYAAANNHPAPPQVQRLTPSPMTQSTRWAIPHTDPQGPQEPPPPSPWLLNYHQPTPHPHNSEAATMKNTVYKAARTITPFDPQQGHGDIEAYLMERTPPHI